MSVQCDRIQGREANISACLAGIGLRPFRAEAADEHFVPITLDADIVPVAADEHVDIDTAGEVRGASGR